MAVPPQEKEKRASLDPKIPHTDKSGKDGNKGDSAPPGGDGNAPDKKGEGRPHREHGRRGGQGT